MEHDSFSLGRFRFDRVEFAGSLGDLGTFLPIVVAIILINKLSPTQRLAKIGHYDNTASKAGIQWQANLKLDIWSRYG